ncbi:MAG: NERD domain-containing protein [Verrucomicrobia bacterium]|nr:NERD domain-containing protein [Verrucomicrobiota bacterium]
MDLYGGEKNRQWTQVNFKKKNRFQNPLRQNYKHTKTLSELTGIPHEVIHSVVVFVGEAEFKTERPANMIQGKNLTRHIRAYQQHLIQDEQVPEIAEVIGQWAIVNTRENRRRHVEALREKRSKV